MKEAENEDGEGKRKVESLWPWIHIYFFAIYINPQMSPRNIYHSRVIGDRGKIFTLELL